jgi:hypothetical protein
MIAESARRPAALALATALPRPRGDAELRRLARRYFATLDRAIAFKAREQELGGEEYWAFALGPMKAAEAALDAADRRMVEAIQARDLAGLTLDGRLYVSYGDEAGDGWDFCPRGGGFDLARIANL